MAHKIIIMCQMHRIINDLSPQLLSTATTTDLPVNRNTRSMHGEEFHESHWGCHAAKSKPQSTFKSIVEMQTAHSLQRKGELITT